MRTYKERTERILEKATKQKQAKKQRTIAISVTATALSLVLGLNLALFVPYTEGGINIAKYKGSEYYSVISQLSELTYPEPTKTSNFQKLFEAFAPKLGASAPMDEGDMHPMSPGVSDGAASPGTDQDVSYEEVTNNQTEGVIEGDLFKRSSDHIYYLSYTPANYEVIMDCTGGTADKIEVYREATLDLMIYSIEGASSKQVATFKIEPEEGMSFLNYEDERELFLSADCKTVTILTPCRDSAKRLSYTSLISVDVSDPENIHINQRTYLSGSYVSARVANGNFLIVSNFSVRYEPDFSDEAQFVPQIGAYGDMKSLPVQDIVLPDEATRAQYTVISSLDGNTLEAVDSVAFLSYSDDVYVSQSNLFVTREAVISKSYLECGDETAKQYQLSYTYPATEIYCVSYEGGALETKGNVTVDGSVNDRFSLDEYKNVLRVVTTTDVYNISYNYTDKDPYSEFRKRSANLYCIDLDTLETIAKVEHFAPSGESVKSARFDRETAYVCTAEVTYGPIIDINDPVFAFDLSDYNNITYKDTGTIPGYSLSLMTFTHDTLLGIGYGDGFNTLKIELYRETDSEVVTAAKYEAVGADFSKQFKAYFIDRENGFIGLGMSCYNEELKEWLNGYLLLHYDGESLTAKMISVQNTAYDDMRATYTGGNLYLVGYDLFKVIAVG